LLLALAGSDKGSLLVIQITWSAEGLAFGFIK